MLGNLESLYKDIMALKESIPIEWRPDHDVFAEPREHQLILVLHIEFHTLLMGFYAIIGALSKYSPHPTFYSKFRTSAKVSNARRMFQIADTIRSSPHFNPAISCW